MFAGIVQAFEEADQDERCAIINEMAHVLDGFRAKVEQTSMSAEKQKWFDGLGLGNKVQDVAKSFVSESLDISNWNEKEAEGTWSCIGTFGAGVRVKLEHHANYRRGVYKTTVSWGDSLEHSSKLEDLNDDNLEQFHPGVFVLHALPVMAPLSRAEEIAEMISDRFEAPAQPPPKKSKSNATK